MRFGVGKGKSYGTIVERKREKRDFVTTCVSIWTESKGTQQLEKILLSFIRL